MLVNQTLYEETSKDIIYEFEQLLCNRNIKINNKNCNENIFKSEDSYINEKDYKKLKEKVIVQLESFVDYLKYKMQNAA